MRDLEKKAKILKNIEIIPSKPLLVSMINKTNIPWFISLRQVQKTKFCSKQPYVNRFIVGKAMKFTVKIDKFRGRPKLSFLFDFLKDTNFHIISSYGQATCQNPLES